MSAATGRSALRALALGALGTVVALAAPGASGASAQEWTLDARVGRLDFELSTAPAAMSVGLGLGYRGESGSFRLAAGVPTGESDPLWAAIGGASRLTGRWGAVEAGVDVSGSGFLQRYPVGSEGADGPLGGALPDGEPLAGYGVAIQALPLVAVHAGPAELRVRAGPSYYRAGLGDAETTRQVALADARLLMYPVASVALTADVRRFTGDAGSVTFAGGGLLLARPELSLWASAGRWLGEEAAADWSIGGAIPLVERLRLTVQARQQSLDPLYGSAARRAWELGLQLALNRPPEPAAPVPAGYRNGRAIVALAAEDAQGRPSIAGDFNGWTPEPMTREGDRWVHLLDVEPGVYEYAFVDSDGDWFVPEDVPGRKDDGMGGHVALLIVEGES